MLGKRRKLLMRAEIGLILRAPFASVQCPQQVAGRYFERLVPRCSGGQDRPFYGCGRRCVARGLLFGFVAQERVFERYVLIGGIQTHGFPKLVARAFILPTLSRV